METSSDESDGEIFALDESGLRPYDFEPVGVNPSSTGEQTSGIDIPPEQRRQGNILWCRCGKCREMGTEEESICCRDEDVPDSYFAEKMCITENENFRAVCLNREVLKTVLHMLNNVRGDEINIQNKSLRYAGYRQFTWWVHNRLGKGVRKVIPSCTLWAIRDEYAEPNHYYVPFQEVSDEINTNFA